MSTGTTFKVGDRVKTQPFGYVGRVTAVHDSCPGDASWRAVQHAAVKPYMRGDHPFLSVNVDNGGSIWIPAALTELAPQ